MQSIEILLKDSTFKLVEQEMKIRNKDVSNIIDELLSQYFYEINKNKQIDIYFDESKEIWKDIPGYENMYQASNMGRIASIRSGVFKIRSLVRNPTGYLQCGIRINNKIKTYLVHILIAKTFCIKNENCDQVDHINNSKIDNRAENLQWVTKAENIQNNYRRGITIKEKINIKKRVKLFDKNGNSLGIFESVKAASEYLNVSMGNISSLCNGRLKTLTKGKITGKFVREKRSNYNKK